MNKITTVLQYKGGPRDGEQDGSEAALSKLDLELHHEDGDTIVRQMEWEPDHHLGARYVCCKTLRI
jgi:hypothetical protein